MSFRNFELEHYQSQHERQVEFNLADSSVKCTGVSDWLDADEIQQLLDTGLFYPEVNGTKSMRERIAGLYPGADKDQVLVTVGAAQGQRPGLREPVAGTVPTEAEMNGIVALCERAGCWLHADEVYAGTELHGPPADTIWGRYDKVVCVNSMSKAYSVRRVACVSRWATTRRRSRQRRTVSMRSGSGCP